MKQKTPSNKKQPKRGTKDLSDRVHKHLNDKNDIITEDDIKNIKVGEDAVDEEVKGAEEMAKSFKDKKSSSPWNIMGEEE